MNEYAYNIKVNLKKELINFYEWNSKDRITILDKVNVYVLNDEDYQNILSMNIKVEKEFLNNLYNKNTCIFVCDIDSVCIKFNSDGTINMISKLDLEEEYDLLDEINLKNKIKLNYNIINKKNNYSFNTRQENEKINYLLEYLDTIKNEEETINYLYYECFNNKKTNNKYEKLKSTIKGDYSPLHDKIYDLVKLLV